MRLIVVAAAMAAVVLLSACGTLPYTPSEYPLRDGLISSFPAKGQTSVANAQPSADPVIVYSYGGSKLSSDLRSITEVMVQQTNKELMKATQPAAGNAKTVELKVNSLVSTYAIFHWNSTLSFEARLGNGEVITKTVPHTSGVLLQDLNGCIAESVMMLLNDAKFRAYLAE
jgi:hypothetical protein